MELFIVLLSSIVDASNSTKCILLNNQKCMIQSAFINLHSNEYSQEFHHHPFSVKSGRCAGSCNTLNYLSNKVCVPSETEDLDLSMFNIITEIQEFKKLTKHISCRCKCKFDGRSCFSDQWWSNGE